LLDEIRLFGSLAMSVVAVSTFVPVAIRVARRTAFLDHPVGYKGHAQATPYLGGAAVMAAFTVTAVALGGGASRFWVIILCALALFAVGTVDDRVALGPWIRLALEAGVGFALWSSGLGWSVVGSPVADLLLTIVWIVGIVNAFNLMDNMDGATATVGATSSTGVAMLALVYGDPMLAALMLAVAGACAGFLPFNLARPSRIFLGDGGSMPIGFLIGASIIAVPFGPTVGWAAVLVAVPLVGLVILDTTLVMFSRRRRNAPLLSGGRDHLTHRLREQLGSAQVVALALAFAQACLCAVAVVLSQAGQAAVLGVALVLVVAGAAVIYVLEMPWQSERLAPSAPSAVAGQLAVQEEQFV
jgi:UDP-GlcNAc:undecaprenyl-phosphate/decaprenyl-phosphate GlcNAc-1-phosphate transferase